MKKLNIFICLIASIVLSVSCAKEGKDLLGDIRVADTVLTTIKLDLGIASVQTKMREVKENLISDLNIYIFNSKGDVVGWFHNQSNTPISVRVSKKDKYDIYVVANAGEEIKVRQLSELKNYCYNSPTIEGISLEDGATLMVGKSEGLSLSEGVVIPIKLERRVAKIVIFADTSQLNKDVQLTFESLTIKDAPESVKLFNINKMSKENSLLSYTLDCEEMFGSGARCYLYENMQGTLKPENTEQRNKVLLEGERGYGCATYIEIKCGYKSTRYEGTIYYKFYLGGDALTNFDVIGNTLQVLKIYFKGNGSVRENSWRVETTELTDNSYISLEDEFLFLYPTDKAMLRWATFFSDDQMPTVTASDPSAVKILKVDTEGIEIEAVGEGNIVLQASLGPRVVSCQLFIAYPVVYFDPHYIPIEINTNTTLNCDVNSIKGGEPVQFERIDDLPEELLFFPYGNRSNVVHGTAFTNPEKPVCIRAWFINYPDFPGDTIRVDIVKYEDLPFIVEH